MEEALREAVVEQWGEEPLPADPRKTTLVATPVE
jgi:hypothetical protein